MNSDRHCRSKINSAPPTGVDSKLTGLNCLRGCLLTLGLFTGPSLLDKSLASIQVWVITDPGSRGHVGMAGSRSAARRLGTTTGAAIAFGWRRPTEWYIDQVGIAKIGAAVGVCRSVNNCRDLAVGINVSVDRVAAFSAIAIRDRPLLRLALSLNCADLGDTLTLLPWLSSL